MSEADLFIVATAVSMILLGVAFSFIGNENKSGKSGAAPV